jgi:hypothetical protein
MCNDFFIDLAHGAWTDGATNYINASICTLGKIPSNQPIIFDIELPESLEKASFEEFKLEN